MVKRFESSHIGPNSTELGQDIIRNEQEGNLTAAHLGKLRAVAALGFGKLSSEAEFALRRSIRDYTPFNKGFE